MNLKTKNYNMLVAGCLIALTCLNIVILLASMHVYRKIKVEIVEMQKLLDEQSYILDIYEKYIEPEIRDNEMFLKLNERDRNV